MGQDKDTHHKQKYSKKKAYAEVGAQSLGRTEEENLQKRKQGQVVRNSPGSSG